MYSVYMYSVYFLIYNVGDFTDNTTASLITLCSPL